MLIKGHEEDEHENEGNFCNCGILMSQVLLGHDFLL